MAAQREWAAKRAQRVEPLRVQADLVAELEARHAALQRERRWEMFETVENVEAAKLEFEGVREQLRSARGTLDSHRLALAAVTSELEQAAKDLDKTVERIATRAAAMAEPEVARRFEAVVRDLMLIWYLRHGPVGYAGLDSKLYAITREATANAETFRAVTELKRSLLASAGSRK